MIPFRIRYTPVAAESIRHLHPSVKQAIREEVRNLSVDPFRGHPLTFELSGYRSLPVSRYRVTYRIRETNRALEIHLVGPRRDIYEVFREFLDQARRG